MATDGVVSRLNEVDYAADGERLLQSILLQGSGTGAFAARSGRRPGAGLEVSYSGLVATVARGGGVILDGATGEPWTFALPASRQVTHAARPGTGLIRKDLVVARIYDTSGQRELKIEIVEGVASATPSKPALPARSLELGTADVPATGSVSFLPNRARSVASGGVLPVTSVEARDALPSPHVGMVVAVETTRGLSVRRADGWDDIPPAQDTGWVNLTLSSGYESYSPETHGTAAARLKNGIVYFRGGITRTSGSFPSGEVTVIARVPDSLRPPTQYEAQAPGSSSFTDPKISILRAGHTPSANAGQLRAHVGSSTVPAYIVLTSISYPID